MTSSIDPQNDAEFDAHVGRYHDMHSAALTVSGEDPEYFAHYKFEVLQDIIGKDETPILDYGCGIGNVTHLLAAARGHVHGYDPSAKSVGVARERAPSANFYDNLEDVPRGTFGTVVLANVLHHVPPPQRADVINGIVPLLAPGGRVVIIEHNRWNPLTVQAVRRCEFDKGVTLLSKPEITALLQACGLEKPGYRFIVFFPHVLRHLRRIEPKLGSVPLGAQVCVWAHLRSSV
jgi:2-polyprenyl-3-methyl-5-hydroxy-6-metoxy-1,4-benzoquinol methylase